MVSVLLKVCALLYLRLQVVSAIIPLTLWPTSDFSECPNQTWLPPNRTNQLDMTIEYSTMFLEDLTLVVHEDLRIDRPNSLWKNSSCFQNLSYVWELETKEFVVVSMPGQEQERDGILVYMDDDMNYGVLYHCRSLDPSFAIFKRDSYKKPNVKRSVQQLMLRFGVEYPNLDHIPSEHPEVLETERLVRKCDLHLPETHDEGFPWLIAGAVVLVLIAFVLLCYEVL